MGQEELIRKLMNFFYSMAESRFPMVVTLRETTNVPLTNNTQTFDVGSILWTGIG
jgi:hypothetical protein